MANILIRQLDDHGILMKIFKDFDQNSVDKPQYLTIQTTEFFNKQMTNGILMIFFKDFDENFGCQENSDQYSDQKIR